MPILCSGMVAASPAAPTGAQHCPPQTLRGASGSHTPGNRLPQPTTQPAAKTYLPLILPCMPPWRYRRGTTAKSYRRVLPPARLPLGQPTRRACCRNLLPRPTCRSYYRAYPRTTYLPLIPPCIPPWNYRKKLPPCATAGTPTPQTTYLPGILPRDGSYRAMAPAPSGRVIRM